MYWDTMILLNYINKLSFSNLVEQEVRTNNACWTLDGGVLMDRFSHVQYVTRLTYQLVSYILQQLPSEYECLLDANKFFAAISISVETEPTVQPEPLATIQPEPTVPGHPEPTVTVAPEITVTVAPEITVEPELEPNPNLVNKRVNPGPWKYAPNSAAILGQSPQDATNPLVMWRHHYMNWVDHCQNRGQFIPYRYNYNYKEEKTRIMVGKIGASRPKGSNGKFL